MVSKLAHDTLFEQNCHLCADNFKEEDIPTAINLGPIGGEDGNSVVNAHNRCFDEIVSEHPEVKRLIGKKPRDWNSNDKEMWKNTFSSVPKNTGLGKLFGKKN